MDAIKNAYYRSFQAVFNVAARCLYWRKPITVEGEGALSKAPELFKKNHVKKVMIVTGRTVGKTIAPIAKAALDKAGIAYEHYSEVSANPTVTVVNEIQKKYLETGCKGFLAIGGGSPMDAAKGAKVVFEGESDLDNELTKALVKSVEIVNKDGTLVYAIENVEDLEDGITATGTSTLTAGKEYTAVVTLLDGTQYSKTLEAQSGI